MAKTVTTRYQDGGALDKLLSRYIEATGDNAALAARTLLCRALMDWCDDTDTAIPAIEGIAWDEDEFTRADMFAFARAWAEAEVGERGGTRPVKGQLISIQDSNSDAYITVTKAVNLAVNVRPDLKGEYFAVKAALAQAIKRDTFKIFRVSGTYARYIERPAFEAWLANYRPRK